jgi:hypothetical protein
MGISCCVMHNSLSAVIGVYLGADWEVGINQDPASTNL